MNVRKASDRQHLEAIDQAYAFYAQLTSNPTRAALVAELEALRGRKRARTTTDLHLIVKRFVSYGGDTPAERLAAYKLVSRDVRAIQHLHAHRGLLSRVQALGAATGEGLHAWARQSAVARSKPVRKTRLDSASGKRQRTLIHEFVLTVRKPDLSQQSRTRFRVTDVLMKDMAPLVRLLKKSLSIHPAEL